jgi:two-component system response regulator HydG
LKTPAALSLLIADDDRFVREACREAATVLGSRTSACESAEQAFHLIDSQAIDIVLLDLKSIDAGRLELLRRMKQRRRDAEIIVTTSTGTVRSAVQAMKTGAYDYVTKPFGMEELKLLLARVSDQLKVKIERRMLAEQNKSTRGFGSIIGRAPKMEKLSRIIGKAAHTAHPVLILGESGTGKEMVARAIHNCGPFRDKPFRACGLRVSCSYVNRE